VNVDRLFTLLETYLEVEWVYEEETEEQKSRRAEEQKSGKEEEGLIPPPPDEMKVLLDFEGDAQHRTHRRVGEFSDGFVMARI